MRLPGEAWLEWRLTPTADGGTELCQRALFHPRGVWGRVYWYAMVPFHFVIFRPLLTRLVELAEAQPVQVETNENRVTTR